MKMRFTFNDEYAGVGGVVNCGGTLVDLAKDVVDGLYESEVPTVQQTLSELRGRDGRVFTSVIVNEDGTTAPVELEPIPEKPVLRTPTEAAAELEAQAQDAPPTAPNTGTNYDALPIAELKAIIVAKGLPVPSNVTTKAEMVEILDQADATNDAV